MAFSVGAIEAKLTANTAQFNTNIQKSTGHLQTLQDRALQTSQKLQEIGDAADRTAKRASLALAALVGVMGNAVRMASAQREAELRLAAAIRGTGQAIDVNKIRAYAAELQNLTTYGDEATIEAAGLLATFQLTENAIVALLPRIQNLSAMYKMDLSQAALQVGRALTQGAGALSRYGITMTEAEKQAYNMATQTEKVAMLLEIFDRNTGDAAQTLAGTGVGAFTQFKNAVGDLNEAIGFLLEQRVADFFQEATRRVQRLTTWFQNLDDDTKDLLVTWVGWTAGILAAVAGVSMLVSVLAKLARALTLVGRAVAAHPLIAIGIVAGALALSVDELREKVGAFIREIPVLGDAFADMSDEWAELTEGLPDADPSSVAQTVLDAQERLRAQIAAEGALAGEEWMKAFAKAAAGLPGIIGLPGMEYRLPFAGTPGSMFEFAPESLGLTDATEEQLNAALDLVRDFSSRLQAELNVGRAVAAVTGEPFAEAETKLEATRALLHALVEEAGVPISSPFAQQLLSWIEALNAQLPQTVEQLSLIEQLMGFRAGTIEADVGARLQALQRQAEGADVILAKAAQSQIDAAVSAFEEAFLRTADTGQAAAAALVALAGTAPNFRMLDSASLAAADAVEELADATNLSLKAQRAWALRMQGQADAWRESLSLWEKFTMGLREAGRTLSDRLGAAIVRESPILSDVTSAVQTAAPGGPQAMAVAGITALLAHSETFGKIMSILNGLLQVAADAIGALLEPLLPLVAVVATVLGPMFEMLGVILSSLLLPALQLLFPVIKIVGLALLYLGRGVSWVVNKIIEVINFVIRVYNFLLGWLTGKIKELQTIDLGTFDQAIRELNNLTWDSARAKAEELAATKAVTEALINVPDALNLNLLRWRSAVVAAIPSAQTGGDILRGGLVNVHRGERIVPAQVVRGEGAAGGGIVVNVGIREAYGDNVERQFERAAVRGIRRAVRRTGLAASATVF